MQHVCSSDAGTSTCRHNIETEIEICRDKLKQASQLTMNSGQRIDFLFLTLLSGVDQKLNWKQDSCRSRRNMTLAASHWCVCLRHRTHRRRHINRHRRKKRSVIATKAYTEDRYVEHAAKLVGSCPLKLDEESELQAQRHDLASADQERPQESLRTPAYLTLAVR